MEITLPQNFRAKLEKNAELSGAVSTACALFGNWFSTSGMPFFKDYTDHGPKHIMSVLAMTDAMMTEESLDLVTPADIAVLVYSVLLHDAALHIAENTLKALVKHEPKVPPMVDFDDKPWAELWSQFLFEVSRWDDKKLVGVFGETFIKECRRTEDPFLRWENLDDDCRKLIGEFVRRHHARLAHEFAIGGIPGTTLDLPPSVSPKFRNLAGLIARSHGMPVRSCLDYLTQHFHKREFQGVHAVYLMCILRISDFLQIDSSRAPSVVLQYRTVASSESRLEWAAHQAVSNVTAEHDDPESIEVTAVPLQVEVFLRLRQWLEGLQSEFDASWAVMGEVYGSSRQLRRLGLRWRRVRSNLDDIESFGKKVSYIPRRIRMEVARVELFKLLIRPLYGNNPSFGVRELLQNALDAVRERTYLSPRRATKLGGLDEDVDIVLRLVPYDEEQGCGWLEIKDRGQGMTESIVENYFLKVGASFRYSEEWGRTYGEKVSPEGSRQAVIRSGRFGIGALATFLLGNSIEVESRHVDAEEGLKFSLGLSDESIHVERVKGLEVGTGIRVRLTKEVCELLADSAQATSSAPRIQDWYILDKPSIRYDSGSNDADVSPRYRHNLSKWNKLMHSCPYEVHWTYLDAPKVSCNGILVMDSLAAPKIPPLACGGFNWQLPTPNIHVTDRAAAFPISLTRSEVLDSRYPFEVQLQEAVRDDVLAWMLMEFPEDPSGQNISKIRSHPVFGSALPELLFSRDGYRVASYGSLTNSGTGSGIRHLLQIHDLGALRSLDTLLHWDAVLCSHVSSEMPQSITVVNTSLKWINAKYSTRHGAALVTTKGRMANGETLVGFRASMSSDSWMECNMFIDECMKIGVHLSVNEPSEVQHGTDLLPKAWIEFGVDKADRYGFDQAVTRRIRVLELVLKHELSHLSCQSDAGAVWSAHFGNHWLPWSIEDRKRAFPEIFERAKPFFGQYRWGESW